MKKRTLLAAVALGMMPVLFFTLSGFTGTTVILDTHRVGDIVYSILKPEDFRKEHGGGWVLMQGDTVRDSRLSKDYGISIVPNTCGRFIRGMNYNGKGDDPETRTVGSFQDDAFERHSHHGAVGELHGGLDGGGSGSIVVRRDPTSETGGDETRPKNVAFYTYIKIND